MDDQEVQKRQIIVNCSCWNKYHMYWEKPFTLYINWPILLKCSVCWSEYDLFKLGKKVDRGTEQ